MLALLAATIAGTPVLAHDFWVQPQRFSLAAPGPASVTMLVGHGAARDRWGVAPDRILLFRTIGPDGTIDRRSNITMNGPGRDAAFNLARNGSYLVLLQSTSASSELPALRFNDYVNEEGITPIAAQRRRAGTEDREGRESYSRRAKTIVQVGRVDASSIARVTKPANLLLEIVPARHPLALTKDRRLPVQVLYRGRPLPGALVKLTNLANDAEPVAKIRTGVGGRATFTLPGAGQWQMNVVWAAPLRNDARGDFETTFSSLTFATTG